MTKKAAGHKKDDNPRSKVRKVNSPSRTQHPVLQLQQTIGNRAVTNLIQRKKVINEDVFIDGNLKVANVDALIIDAVALNALDVHADDVFSNNYRRALTPPKRSP